MGRDFENMVTDWLTVAKYGTRRTEKTKKITRRIRQYRGLSPAVSANGNPILRRMAWGRPQGPMMAMYSLNTGIVLINADDMWGIAGRRLQRDLLMLMGKLEQDKVFVSFQACDIARIDLNEIRLIHDHQAQFMKKTLPEDTPPNLKQRTAFRFFFKEGKRPSKEEMENVCRLSWGGASPRLIHKKGVAGWEWGGYVDVEIPPAEDGYYHWEDRWSRPGCIFRVGKKRYISAFDKNDRPPRYFLSELPAKEKAFDMDSARYALAPKAVRMAWKQERKVVRQGDLFAIKTDLREKDLTPEMEYRCGWKEWLKWHSFPCSNLASHYSRNAASSWMSSTNRGCDCERSGAAHFHDIASRLIIHGTAHTCTEVIKLKDGTVYGRGMMRHEPHLLRENRERDHQNMLLDDGKDGWWLLVRNTVPAL